MEQNQGKEKKRASLGWAGLSKMGGALGGGLAGLIGLGKQAEDAFEGLGEAYHGAKLAKTLTQAYFREGDFSQDYIGLLDQPVRDAYNRNISEEKLLVDASREALEAMQRGSLKLPTQDSVPIKGLKGIKGKIIEGTKKLIGNGEEAEIQNSEQYAINHNGLAQIRMATIGKREILREEIGQQSGKLEVNRQSIGAIDKEGMSILEGLVKEYNFNADLLRNIDKLDMREINAGSLNKSYQAVIKQADDYGLLKPSFEAWGDAGVLGVSLLGAYLGYKIVNPFVKAGKVTGAAIRNTKRLAKGIRKRFKTKKETI